LKFVEKYDKKGNFEMTHVIHEIPPVYDDRSKILILGSFPSVKSREGQFFYHHKQTPSFHHLEIADE
jgi:TDG/mug DNA glycosylase family protein